MSRDVIKLFHFKVLVSKVKLNIFLCLIFCCLFYLFKHMVVCSQASCCSCQGSSLGETKGIFTLFKKIYKSVV